MRFVTPVFAQLAKGVLFPKAVTLPVVPNQDDGCGTYTVLPSLPSQSSLLSPKTPSTLPSFFLLIMIDGPFVPLYEAVASDEDAWTGCRSTCCAADSFTLHGSLFFLHIPCTKSTSKAREISGVYSPCLFASSPCLSTMDEDWGWGSWCSEFVCGPCH